MLLEIPRQQTFLHNLFDFEKKQKGTLKGAFLIGFDGVF
jgi:hypothetical protein